MAIPWLAVLQSVPWTEVISNAPKVADGAKKLWNAVARKPSSKEVGDSSTPPQSTAESRFIALETAVSDLHSQMLASSELIKTLAEQNAQLVQRIESNRKRVLWLSSVTAVLAMAALVGFLLALSMHGT